MSIPRNKGKTGVQIASEETRRKMSLSHFGKPLLMNRRRILKKCKRCGKEFETGGRAGNITKIFCSNHCSKMVKNGRTVHPAGYMQIFIDGKRILEHRIIAEKCLGRSLGVGEIVHHINGIKKDNRPENLLVMTQAQHMKLTSYLSNLWLEEHMDMADKIAREFVTASAEA